jgi:hypothetical protein
MAPGQWALLAVCAVFAPLFNFVLVALDNLLFLLFPVRVMAATPGDFQALGRNVLLSLGKLIGLVVVGMLVVTVAVTVYFLSDRNLLLAVCAAYPILAGCGVALVPLVAVAFRWFDVGRHTPA